MRCSIGACVEVQESAVVGLTQDSEDCTVASFQSVTCRACGV